MNDGPLTKDTPSLSLRSPSSAYTEPHQRESIALLQMMSGDVRQAVLLALAQGGPAHVGQLAERVNTLCPWSQKIDQKLLSHHLAHLRRAGVVHERRHGRHHVYDIDPAHVLYQPLPGGGFSLKIRARGPVAVIVEVGNDQRMSTDVQKLRQENSPGDKK